MQTCRHCGTCTPDGYVCDCQDAQFAADMASINALGWDADDRGTAKRERCARIWYKRVEDVPLCNLNKRPPPIQLRLWDYRYMGQGYRFDVKFTASLGDDVGWVEFKIYAVDTVGMIEPAVRRLMKAWVAVNTPE